MKTHSLMIAIVVGLVCSGAQAEKADRDKPVNLEADRITVDDARKVHVLEGNVQLVQGTMVIRTDKLVVSQDADGYQTSVAHGGPGGLVRFRQKREGKDELVEGEAERLEHNGRTEKAEFFGQAHVKSGQDEIRGQYIAYDGRTEQFVVTGVAKGGAAVAPDRVRAVIQPKRKEEGKAGMPSKPEPPLRSAAELANPRKE